MDNVTTHRNWLDLPPEITASILARVGAISIFISAEKVCKSWLQICRDPLTWRTIVICDPCVHVKYNLDNICREAVNRSCGQLVELSLECLGSDGIVKYITERSKGIKLLRLARCRSITSQGMSGVAPTLPMLEDLEISVCPLLRAPPLDVFARCCPLLKTLKLNYPERSWCPFEIYDNDARAIAAMPGLQHLQIFGNNITHEGLIEILECCPRLESLDLRHCRNLWIDGDLDKRLATQIKNLRFPYDSTRDYEYDITYDDEAPSSPFADDSHDLRSDHDCYDYYDQTMIIDSTMDMDIEECHGLNLDNELYQRLY